MRWTDEMDEFFVGAVPGHTWREVSAMFDERFGVTLTEGQVSSRKTRLGVRAGVNKGCFTKGNVPHNKGVPVTEWMSPEGIEASKATRFKEGELRGAAKAKRRPVGSTIVDSNGYVLVKVRDGRFSKYGNVETMARHVWRRHHGEIPDGHVVRHVDGDKQNNDIDNLRLVSRQQMALMVNRKYGPVLSAETFDLVDAMTRLHLEANGKEA